MFRNRQQAGVFGGQFHSIVAPWVFSSNFGILCLLAPPREAIHRIGRTLNRPAIARARAKRNGAKPQKQLSNPLRLSAIA